jgi:hypothetical protein
MSPAATRGYEWQTLSSRKREQSVCKLPKRSFRAARRPKTAPFVDGRARYP